MSETYTQLGKIQRVGLGKGGYDDAMFGVSFTLGGDGWGVQDFWGTWASYSPGAKYTQDDWMDGHVKSYFRLMDIMKFAKVSDISELEGIPVEVMFKNSALQSWRVLTEVL